MANNASIFDKVFDDSARIVMAVVPGDGGWEFQIYDRDSDPANPTLLFMLKDDDINNFITARLNGIPGVLWSAGVTAADFLHYRESGESLPGVRLA